MMGDREEVTPTRSLCGRSHPRAPHPALPPSIAPCVTPCLAVAPGMAVGTHRAVRRDPGHNPRRGPTHGDPQSWGRESSAAPSWAPTRVPAPAPLSGQGTQVSSWTGPLPGLHCGSVPLEGFRLPVGWHQGLLPDPLPPHSTQRIPGCLWGGTRICCQTLSHPAVPTGSL